MKTSEEVEGWYEEEKKKAMERFLAALEKKEQIGQLPIAHSARGGIEPEEEAEKKYIKELDSIFEKYKKMNIEMIGKSLEKAKAAAAQKARPKKQPFGLLSKLFKRR